MAPNGNNRRRSEEQPLHNGFSCLRERCSSGQHGFRKEAGKNAVFVQDPVVEHDGEERVKQS